MAFNTFYKKLDSLYLPLVCCSALFLLVALPACTCRYVDCEGNEVFNVRFLSASDSTDLFETGHLSYDSLQVLAWYPDGSKPWNHRYTDFFNTEYDVAIELQPGLQGYIFQTSAGSQDTMILQMLQTLDSPCCPGVLVLDYALYKGDTLFTQGNGELLLLQ